MRAALYALGCRRHGIDYRHAAKNRSEIYLELHPLIATGRAVLLDQPTLLAKLRQLERRTSRLGRDTIDHPSRGHDDQANAVALALVLAEEDGQVVAFDARAVVSVG